MTTTNRITNFLLVMGAVSVASCAKPPGLPPKPTEVTVQTVVAQARTVKRVQLFPGTTASVHPVKISARVTGFLEQAHVADGAVVNAGDLLYTIDQQPFQATLDQAKGTLAQANAQHLRDDPRESAVALAPTRQPQASINHPAASLNEPSCKR